MNEKQQNAKSQSHNQTQPQQEEQDRSAFWPHNSTKSNSNDEDVGKNHSLEPTTSKVSTSLNGRQHVGRSEMDHCSTSSTTSSHPSHQQHGNTDGHLPSNTLYYRYPIPLASPSYPSMTASSFSSNPTSYNPHQHYNHFFESNRRNSSDGIQQSSRDDAIRRDYRTNLAQDPQGKHSKDNELTRIHQNDCPSSSFQVPIAFDPSRRGYDYQYQSHRNQKNTKNYDYNTVVNRRRNISPADPNTFNDDYDSNYKQPSRTEEKEVTSSARDKPRETNEKHKHVEKKETQKKKKRKKNRGAPKRPLSAYNIFFKQERQRMLQSLPRMDNDPTSNSPSKSSRRRKGRDRPHGKISFENLAKTIGSRWRELGSTERKKFEILAAKDTERYAEEMKVFKDEQMMKAPTILSNDHSHEDPDKKVSSSSRQRTTADYVSSSKYKLENRKTGSQEAALEGEIEPVPFDSVFLPPSPFAFDDTNENWSLKDYSFDSLDMKKAG